MTTTSRSPRSAIACATVLILGALLAPAAFASGSVITFDGGANPAGWTWGPPPDYETAGGNPGAWLHGVVDTFAPQLRTSTLSVFTGNFRTKKIVSLGVDLNTLSTQFPASRPLALQLIGPSGTVYFLSEELVPQEGTGWKSFDVDVPSQSTTLPAGWSVLSGAGSDDAVWNSVIQNVTELCWFYGDPTNFFIFDIWDVGADNLRIYSDPFTNLGDGLAGTTGTPVLSGSGTLAPAAPMALTLTNAAPSAAVALFIGLSELNAPFKGGVLVPNADVVLIGLFTDGAGGLVLGADWPTGIPAGFELFFQHWITDAGGPAGFAASNGLRGVAS